MLEWRYDALAALDTHGDGQISTDRTLRYTDSPRPFQIFQRQYC